MWRTAAFLSAVFVFDLGFTGQGFLSIFGGVVGLIVMTVSALWILARRGPVPAVRHKAIRAGMYLFLVGAAIATVQFHLATAANHAEQVIAACRTYQARHGALPDRLDELVPEFLPKVPSAKYTLQYGQFTYTASAEAHTLMYVVTPPFGRRAYNFEQAKWSQFD